ncbi:hypothetical protein [Dictyobacter formicarum]|uniref:Uncharacterized protein n=1 Tax=Dictyobacter formicarum TaxID=2778368 RepID=A0ABQ3VQW1_9CHLR|nr:hypothetical protein [Dictyobacter formicarum]GHO88213.1 hypothetical protein KSZ_62190 [Dictyobacter formicarum]
MNIPQREILYLFTVTAEHIALIKRMHVCWEDCKSSPSNPGAPAISRHRTYGNSDIYGDIAEIIGITQPNEELGEEYSREQMERMHCIHRETQLALQIFLSTGTMQPGTYVSDCSVFIPGGIKAISDDTLRNLAHDPEHYRLLCLRAEKSGEGA